MTKKIDDALIGINACHFECEAGPLNLNVDWQALLEGIAELEAEIARLRKPSDTYSAYADAISKTPDALTKAEKREAFNRCATS